MSLDLRNMKHPGDTIGVVVRKPFKRFQLGNSFFKGIYIVLLQSLKICRDGIIHTDGPIGLTVKKIAE